MKKLPKIKVRKAHSNKVRSVIVHEDPRFPKRAKQKRRWKRAIKQDC